MKHVRSLLAIGTVMISVVANAEGPTARSLFANTTGVTFDSKTGTQARADKKRVTAPKISTATADQYMGMSYTVYQKLPSGESVVVSPKTRFKTDDLISVEVKSNAKGIISVANVNPKGEFSYLGSQVAEPGAVVRIPSKGNLRFVGDAGLEKLIFLLSAAPIIEPTTDEELVSTIFTSCETTVTTRSLVVDDDAGNQYRVIKADGRCTVEMEEREIKTRSLVVDVSDDKGYGVVPKSKIDSGEILALGISLRHE